ncbi:hypothetical protein SDC9_115125 [bioreactor metagenome]|uniref:Uncharacterized protein n=1 Tax=bioreactor metagenome TaxID=1076179 RepID=A0A645C2J4_9ZZZZ
MRRRPHVIGRGGHREHVTQDHHQDHQHGRQNRAARDDEADEQEQHLNHLVNYRPQGECQDALEGGPALFDGGDNASEARFGEHDARRRLRRVCRRGHRNAHLRLPQCGRVVDAVAAHRHDVPRRLQLLDERELVFGQHAGIHASVLDVDARRYRRAGAYRPLDADLVRHRGSRCRCIAGHHHRAHAQLRQLLDQRRRVGPWRIAQADQPGQLQRAFRAKRHSEHPLTVLLEPTGFVGNRPLRCATGTVRHQSGDHRVRALRHHVHNAIRIPNRCRRPLL